MIDFTQVQDNVLRSLTEGVIAISFDGTITYANDAAVEILNMPQGLTGRKFAALFLKNRKTMILPRRCLMQFTAQNSRTLRSYLIIQAGQSGSCT